MWIKKSEYDAIKADLRRAQIECTEYKSKYNALNENLPSFYTIAGETVVTMPALLLSERLSKVNQLEEQVEQLESRVKAWQQKYADEVQKRIALIGQMNR